MLLWIAPLFSRWNSCCSRRPPDPSLIYLLKSCFCFSPRVHFRNQCWPHPHSLAPYVLRLSHSVRVFMLRPLGVSPAPRLQHLLTACNLVFLCSALCIRVRVQRSRCAYFVLSVQCLSFVSCATMVPLIISHIDQSTFAFGHLWVFSNPESFSYLACRHRHYIVSSSCNFQPI